MLFPLLLFVGLGLGIVLLRQASVLERAGYSLALSLWAVPWVAMQVAYGLQRPVSAGLMLLVGLPLAGLLAVPFVSWARQLRWRNPSRWEVGVVAASIAGGLAVTVYHNGAEFWLSLASYLARGEAECFYMQTFRFVPGLTEGAPGWDAMGILTSPGNTVFTTGAMPLYGAQTFRVLAGLLAAVQILFLTLLLRRWIGGRYGPLCVALFSVFNPYTMSVEVLDRNVVALCWSTVLIYSVASHPRRSLLHGVLLGIVAGTGLRFLPLTLCLPVAVLYISNRARPKHWSKMLGAAAITFAVNVPHLVRHGFHSLGETVAFPALTTWSRTPFLPFHNGVFYLQHTASLLGVLVIAVACTGLVVAWRRDRKLVAVSALWALPTLLVLSLQRDWIEGDKHRILLWVLTPVMVHIGFGVDALVRRTTTLRAGVATAGAAVALWVALGCLPRLASPAEQGLYTRKPVYQRESTVFHEFYRSQFARRNLLPGYGRLYLKLDVPRKRTEERLVGNTLFGAGGFSEHRWLSQHLPARIAEPMQSDGGTDEFVDVMIDFDALVTDMDGAVSVVQGERSPFVDLQRQDRLLDIYHRECDASWQAKPLPISVLPMRAEVAVLGELSISLNTMIGLGRDDLGFEQVNFIHYADAPRRRSQGLATAMTALPSDDDSCVAVFRVPADTRIIVRDWLIDQTKGVPFRIDAWDIQIDDEGGARVRFFPFEPESYL